MPHASRENSPIEGDYVLVYERTAHFGDYTVNFVTFREDADHSVMFKGLLDDACQCPHWGYVLAGRIDVTYRPDGTKETIEAGEAFYMPPGHVPNPAAGTEIVLISPRHELELTEAAINANMARLNGQQ